ncbi:MAG TPA: lysylphosphatidylglycerol synthase transmembrane domain-containing protein [Bacilli bacterium]|nr:lysylphosphatidylglycerol synthase transmembrane domain-containing protein [Bacilli bacterium]
MNDNKDPLSIDLSEGREAEVHGRHRPKKVHRKYLINISIVLLITGGVLYFNLRDNLSLVLEAMVNVDYKFILLAMGLVLGTFFIEGIILFILARLYTTRYSVGKGLGNALIGIFYNNVTPGHSGGQFAQAYTFKKQGLEISSAASILVMHFLLNQMALVTWGLLAVIFKLKDFLTIIQPITLFGVNFPTISLAIFGFTLNFIVIVSIFFLAYSKFIHDFVINGIVGLLGKMHIIKHPEVVKSNLHVQIENFRIELRRLQSNIRVTVFLYLLFMFRYLVLYSLPMVIAMSLPTITISGTLWDGVFMTSYLYVITNLVPLPGSAGASELFFSHLFQSLFGSYAATIAPQLIWRSTTFYLTLVVSGFVSAFYRSAPQEDNFQSTRRTFVELQRSTFAIRKISSDTMWETSQLSRREIAKQLKNVTGDFLGIKARRRRKELEKKRKDIAERISAERHLKEKMTLDTDEFLIDPSDPTKD